MEIDKQLFRIEWSRIKSRIEHFKWYCRFYDSQCAGLIIGISIAVVIAFTFLIS